MLADLIREFCNEPENNYEVYENYTKHTSGEFGEMTTTTLGIIVKQGHSCMDMLEQLTSYLEAKGFDDKLLELEGVLTDDLGPDSIVYFPALQEAIEDFPFIQEQQGKQS